MDTDRYSLARDIAAFLIVAAAVPIALFGGSMLGCVGQGFNASCAMSAIAIAPVILGTAGAAAGFISRGWTGLFIGFLGNLAGMASILILSFGIGEPVPLDPVSGVMAMMWFGFPSLTGYGVGFVIWKFLKRLRRPSA